MLFASIVLKEKVGALTSVPRSPSGYGQCSIKLQPAMSL